MRWQRVSSSAHQLLVWAERAEVAFWRPHFTRYTNEGMRGEAGNEKQNNGEDIDSAQGLHRIDSPLSAHEYILYRRREMEMWNFSSIGIDWHGCEAKLFRSVFDEMAPTSMFNSIANANTYFRFLFFSIAIHEFVDSRGKCQLEFKLYSTHLDLPFAMRRSHEWRKYSSSLPCSSATIFASGCNIFYWNRISISHPLKYTILQTRESNNT